VQCGALAVGVTYERALRALSPVTGQRKDALALRRVPVMAPKRKAQATCADVACIRADLVLALAVEPKHQSVRVLADRFGVWS
jgi:hypothetical protein